MSEPEEFIVESEVPELIIQGDLTGWEVIVFELADDEPDDG